MIVKAKIEIPKRTHYKYEIKNNVIYLDRVLNQPLPQNYGYIPGTLAEDGDPLDIFVICAAGIVPGAEVKAEVVGLIRCEDNGEKDDKVIAVLAGAHTRLFHRLFHLDQVELIRDYLSSYKKGMKVSGKTCSAQFAKSRIARCKIRFKNLKGVK